MRGIKTLGALAAMAAGFVPAMAHADPPCQTNFAVYSGGSGLVDMSVLLCEANGPDPDPRLILPGTTAISSAYLLDLGADVPFVMGTFDGLGFNNKVVKFTRSVGNLDDVRYSTPTVALPNGRTSSGCVTVAITFGTGDDAFTESSSYHTADASCPLE